jgi:CDP-diacylglycerol pyrophosphatase
VHDECVPDEAQHLDPAPCTLVDLKSGYVVLKDVLGATQYLVMPTARLAGIESPEILAPDAPNYMAQAWAARRFVEASAHAALKREDLSLAINSVPGRSQNQLHIHVDCLSPDVRLALAVRKDAIGDVWAPFPNPLGGHAYITRRVVSPDLAGVNPFLMLADGVPDARQHMGDYTLVLAGETFAGGPGFVLLADRADPAHGDRASGESLQDHSCALAR